MLWCLAQGSLQRHQWSPSLHYHHHGTQPKRTTKPTQRQQPNYGTYRFNLMSLLLPLVLPRLQLRLPMQQHLLMLLRSMLMLLSPLLSLVRPLNCVTNARLGHAYERTAILQRLANGAPVSPISKAPLTAAQLTTDHALKYVWLPTRRTTLAFRGPACSLVRTHWLA